MSKYSIIADDIIKKIVAGEFAGDKLPPLPRLANDYHVSLQTAVRVVKLLESKGVVTCHAGNIGTRINRNHAILLSEHTVSSLKETDQKIVQPPRKKLRIALSPYVGEVTLFMRMAEQFSEYYPWIETELITSSEINDELEQLSPDAIIALPNNCHALGKRGLLFSNKDLPPCHVDPPAFLPGHEYGVFYTWTVPVIFAKKGTPELQSWEQLLTDDRIHFALHIGLDTFVEYLLDNFAAQSDRSAYSRMIHILHHLYRNALPGANLWANPHSAYQNADCPVNMICTYSSGKESFHFDWNNWEIRQIPPTFSGNQNVPVFGSMLAICKNAANPQEAWLWNNWLLRKDIQKLLIPDGNLFSVNRSIFEQQKGQDPQIAIAGKILQGSYCRELSHCFKYRFCSFAFYHLEQYFKGNVSLEKTVDELMQCTSDLIALDNIFHH